MRIVVLDIAASKTGAVSILKEFAEFTAQNGDGSEWVFITGVPGMIPQARQIKSGAELKGEAGLYCLLRDDVKASWANRLKFEYLTGAGFIRSLKPDVVFSLENTMPRGDLKAVKAVYVHQPLGFQRTKRFSLFKSEERHFAIYQYFISRIIDSSIRRSDRVIVQTRWMREALLDKLHVPANKVYAILPPIPEAPEDIRREAFDCRYFIFPSGPIIYKNHDCVIKAAVLLNKQGIKDFKVVFTLSEKEAGERLMREAGETAGNIEWRGPLKREELFETYIKGTLIFPSYIETFGYPPAEARSVGGLVLASDTPFCREVLEGYPDCRFFDPFSPEELAGLMKEVIEGRLYPENGKESRGTIKTSWEDVVRVVTS